MNIQYDQYFSCTITTNANKAFNNIFTRCFQTPYKKVLIIITTKLCAGQIGCGP